MYLLYILYYRHVGCECTDGWEGSHCEKAIESLTRAEIVQTATSNNSMAWVAGLVVGIVAAGLLVMLYTDKRKKKKQKKTRVSEMTNSYRNNTGEVI
jgi:uncharacterized metal-binding protein